MKRRPRQNDIPELSQTTSYRPLIAFGNMDSSSKFIILKILCPTNNSINRHATQTFKKFTNIIITNCFT
jgi:hypothetical protein